MIDTFNFIFEFQANRFGWAICSEVVNFFVPLMAIQVCLEPHQGTSICSDNLTRHMEWDVVLLYNM